MNVGKTAKHPSSSVGPCAPGAVRFVILPPENLKNTIPMSHTGSPNRFRNWVLRTVTFTVVARVDIEDGAPGFYAETLPAIPQRTRQTGFDLLVAVFRGVESPLQKI